MLNTSSSCSLNYNGLKTQINYKINSFSQDGKKGLEHLNWGLSSPKQVRIGVCGLYLGINKPVQLAQFQPDSKTALSSQHRNCQPYRTHHMVQQRLERGAKQQDRENSGFDIYLNIIFSKYLIIFRLFYIGFQHHHCHS